jgi:membrane protein YdbS with pleckstrin-like domain
MTFPRGLLAQGEDLVLDLRPHWIALVWPLTEIALDAAGVGLILAYMPHTWPTWVRWVVVAVGVALIFVSAVPKIVAWATSHFVVTTDRVIHRSGWFAKRSMEIPLENISDVRFSQGVVQKTIYEMNEANLRRMQAPSVPTSRADELAKLDRLRDEGVISDDEFAAQKARLLDRG